MSRRRRWLIVAAGATAALLTTVGVVALREASPEAGVRAATKEPTRAAPSCGLSGTPGPAVTGATNVRWDTQTGYPLPISATDGPAKRDPSGPWSCFADTPSGAVLAAYVIQLRVGGVAEHWQQVAREQTMPGAGQDALLAAGLSSAVATVPRGFSVSAYSSDRATVALYLHSDQADVTCTSDVRWFQGDWRLELQADGSTSTGCTQEVPASFTPWGP